MVFPKKALQNDRSHYFFGAASFAHCQNFSAAQPTHFVTVPVTRLRSELQRSA
jgi:hypothetical protein